MADPDSSDPRPPRRVGRRERKSLYSVTPTTRLAEMTGDLIEVLKQDKRSLGDKVDRLQGELDRFGREVTRLEASLARVRESLANAEANNVYATTLIAVGGFLVSYAAFTGQLAPAWASLSAGLLAAGVGLLLWQAARRWRRGQDQAR